MSIHMKKVILSLILAVTAMAAAFAQAPANPVAWRSNVKMQSATKGTVTFTAIVSEGWHLYGMQMPKGGPKPTTFSFAGSQGVKFAGAPVPSVQPVKKHDKMFDADVTYWEGRVKFTVDFEITDPAKTALAASVTYMGCNDQTCSPPKTHKFTLRIPAAK
ncbi:hypothetical protein ED551_00425 [Muribaculaceae bacterium Isolate-013 (NCI)]|nr:hypothetical protein ED551_00425 [Muribaculaceae bacterium Isolate-013 (NCI)]